MRNKKLFYSFATIPVVIILVLFAWFFMVIFEGEKPDVTLEPLPEFLSKSESFELKLSDEKRGLKRVRVSINQEGREVALLEKKYPFQGFLNREGIRRQSEEFQIDPATLSLAQGRVDLNIRVWDYSRRGGGDGNLALIRHQMIVDTIPPAIRAVSRMHNVNIGGAGLVVYQASSDTQESGIYVDSLFFPGYPAEESDGKGLHVCYFGIPYDSKGNPAISLWARDKAGNQSRSTFYTHIRKKRFRKDKINISDRFLQRVLPYFSFYPFKPGESDVDKYLEVNNALRQKNHHTFTKLLEKTSPKRLWEGPWLRMENAAPMARFADRRAYYYKGEKIDEQVHLGIDLASLAHSPVSAANNGRVLFAGQNGIYGLAVAVDHGQGILSVYGHLSKIEVTPGQDVKKGDVIGLTGQSGLAGGDHLHFGIMIGGLFVNPIEWWDDHWIEDNITRKLSLLK